MTEPGGPDQLRAQGVSDAEMAAHAAVLAERMDMLTRRIGQLSGQQRRSWRAILGSYGLWVLDIGLIIAMVVFGLHVGAVSQCQAEQNDAFRAASLSGRAARDKQDDQQIMLLDQQLVLFRSVLDPVSTPEQRRVASLDYQRSVVSTRESIVAAKQTRADNPLPMGNCG